MSVGRRAGHSFNRLMFWAGGLLPAAALLVSVLMLPGFWNLRTGLDRFPQADLGKLAEIVNEFCDISSTDPVQLSPEVRIVNSFSALDSFMLHSDWAVPEWENLSFVAPPTLGQVRESLLQEYETVLQEAIEAAVSGSVNSWDVFGRQRTAERTAEDERDALYLLREVLTDGQAPKFPWLVGSAIEGAWIGNGGIRFLGEVEIDDDVAQSAVDYVRTTLAKSKKQKPDAAHIVDIELVLEILFSTRWGSHMRLSPGRLRGTPEAWNEMLKEHADKEDIPGGADGIDVLTAIEIVRRGFEDTQYHDVTWLHGWLHGMTFRTESPSVLNGIEYFLEHLASGAEHEVVSSVEAAAATERRFRERIDSIPYRYQSMERAFRAIERESAGYRNTEIYRSGNPDPEAWFGHLTLQDMPAIEDPGAIDGFDFANDDAWARALESGLPAHCQMEAGLVPAQGLPGLVRSLAGMAIDGRTGYPDGDLMTAYRSLDSWPGTGDVLSLANQESGARLLVWLPAGSGEVRIMTGWGLAVFALTALAFFLFNAIIWKAARPLTVVDRASRETDAALGSRENLQEELQRVKDGLDMDGSKESAASVDAFRNMLGTLISLLRERDEWQGTLLHSLRNDINACIIGLKALPPAADGANPSRHNVDRAAARIKKALENVRYYQRAISGSSEPVTLIDLNSIVGTIVDDITDAGGEASFQPTGQLEAEVRKTAIHSALENLAWNAHIHGGAVIIRTGETGNGEAEIVIEDDGPGIGEDIGELFKPYRRGSQSGQSGAFGGAGLGLTIARRVVDGHGGKLVIENRKAPDGNVKGLRARVVLPLRRPGSLKVRTGHP